MYINKWYISHSHIDNWILVDHSYISECLCDTHAYEENIYRWHCGLCLLKNDKITKVSDSVSFEHFFNSIWFINKRCLAFSATLTLLRNLKQSSAYLCKQISYQFLQLAVKLFRSNRWQFITPILGRVTWHHMVFYKVVKSVFVSLTLTSLGYKKKQFHHVYINIQLYIYTFLQIHIPIHLHCHMYFNYNKKIQTHKWCSHRRPSTVLDSFFLQITIINRPLDIDNLYNSLSCHRWQKYIQKITYLNSNDNWYTMIFIPKIFQ